jgi:hypothetical protein
MPVRFFSVARVLETLHDQEGKKASHMEAVGRGIKSAIKGDGGLRKLRCKFGRSDLLDDAPSLKLAI